MRVGTGDEGSLHSCWARCHALKKGTSGTQRRQGERIADFHQSNQLSLSSWGPLAAVQVVRRRSTAWSNNRQVHRSEHRRCGAHEQAWWMVVLWLTTMRGDSVGTWWCRMCSLSNAPCRGDGSLACRLYWRCPSKWWVGVIWRLAYAEW